MNPLTNVKNITKLNEIELSKGLTNKSSWHNIYKGSAWIFVGGLAYGMTEGDVITVFSQYGEIVNINMVRDKKTGKTKGFCFLCYANQKSTVLAVDNFNGIKLCNRTIRVDHVANYKPPKEHEDTDEITKKLYSEGCAPKPMKKSSSDDESEVLEIPKKLKKPKKEKKKKKKKKKKHVKSDSSDSDEKVSNKKVTSESLPSTSYHQKSKSTHSSSSSSDSDSNSPERKRTKYARFLQLDNLDSHSSKHRTSRTNRTDSHNHHRTEKHNYREKNEQYRFHNSNQSSRNEYDDYHYDKRSHSSTRYKEYDKKKVSNYHK